MMMKHTKPIFILGLLIIIVLLSFKLEIVTLSFDHIMEVLSAIKPILLELKIINFQGMILKPHILALNIKPLLIILLYVGTACLTFILINWKLFLYIILVYIFVKCLLTNFYVKHFKELAPNFNINNITAIWQQRKIIAPFLIKLFLLMIPIRLLMRVCALTLFNFHNDILCIIILVLLTLPFIYYFLNIIRKYLAARQHAFSCFSFTSMLGLRPSTKEKAHIQQHNSLSNSVSEQDYFLFNDYVIKNINLYNIIYMIFTLLIINYYFYYYLAILVLLLVILILLVLYSSTQEKQQDPSLNNNIHLQATSPPLLTLTWACTMDNLGMYLTWGACLGYNEPDHVLSSVGFNIKDRTDCYNQFVLRNVYPNHFNTDINENKHGIATCYNWLHRCVGPAKDGVWFTEEKDIQHAMIIVKSKILSMLYMQRYIVAAQPEFKKEVGSLNYIPQTLFKNDKFIGSVGRLNNNTLVINFLKNDGRLTSKREFWPSYYVHDVSLKHVNLELQPIRQTIQFLEEIYGIYIPNKDDVHNIITYTETEKLRDGDSHLIKIMRPCPWFSDLHSMYTSPKEYFLCSRKRQNWGNWRYGPIGTKVLALMDNVEHHEITDNNRSISEDTLNELYVEYLKTRLTTFDPRVKMEPDKLFNSIRGHLFYNYKSDHYRLKNILLFRQDDLDIFHFKRYCLIDMSGTRERLLEKVVNDNIYSSFYVVSATRLSMELLYIERPYGQLPKISSIIDLTNINTSTTTKSFTPPKQSFNILNKQDGDTLNKLLKSYP